MNFWSLTGKTSYENARALQLKLVELRAGEQLEDTVLLLEHEPVITRGRGLQFTGAPRPRHMPVPAQLPAGMDFAESERGGDLTYHGPGQLVVYPIFKIQDVTRFLRELEGVLIDVLAGPEIGLEASAKADATGVWLGERKIASIGIAIRKWVTYHGAAINCVNDLQAFHLISPCGFAPEVMTRLADVVPAGSVFAGDHWREELESRLIARFSARFAPAAASDRPGSLKTAEMSVDEALELAAGLATPDESYPSRPGAPGAPDASSDYP